MPARPGQAKADAGKHQRKPHDKPALGGSKPRVRRRSAARPTLAEVPPRLDTYSQPKPDGAYFDETAAQAAVDFIESLTHFQGRWAGQPFLLLPWQERFVRELFGWKNADGTRLYRKAYLEVPRKAGKTALAAAIALYMAYGDNEAAPQVFFAAADKDQAGACYGAARVMAEQHPVLGPASVFYNSTKHIIIPANPGAQLRCLSADTRGKYGLNIHALVADELMAWPNRVLWDALTSAGGAREQPLVLAITTAGWDRQSVAFEHHEYGRRIAEGALVDPTFLGVVYGAPDDADWADEAVWLAANPSLGDAEAGGTVQLDYYREQCTAARAMPTAQNAFRTLQLSQWVGQETRLIDMRAWDQNSDDPLPPDKRVAFGGLDLAKGDDLTAFVVVVLGEDETFDIVPYFFAPEEGLRERALRDHAPYDVWVRDGFMTATPGPVTDYGYIRQTVHEVAEQYELRDIGYDRWSASALVQELTHDGIVMAQLGQGFRSFNSPTKELLRLILERKLRHGGHPVLRWNADVCAPDTDAAGNLKPSKQRSTGRIDGIVALIMALDGALRRGHVQQPVSLYDEGACASCGHLPRHHKDGSCQACTRFGRECAHFRTVESAAS